MKNRNKLVLPALIVFLLLAFRDRIVRACGPFFPDTIFINSSHPDLPIQSYAEGNIGVLQPTYSGIYLYVAYRNLAGRPPSKAEQEVLWRRDPWLVAPFGQARTIAPGGDQAAQSHAQAQPKSAQPAQGAQIEPNESPFSSYDAQPEGITRDLSMKDNGGTFTTQFLNCPADAFRNAVSTYKDRSAKFGAQNPIVTSWVTAQQMVFLNCGGSGQGRQIPETLPADAPAMARADRAYQIAAAHFYAMDFDDAAAEFRAIARDHPSPWSAIAPYLVARALVRKATLLDGFKPDLTVLSIAEAQVNSILADSSLSKYHHAAAQLRGFIELRLHPARRLTEIARDMTNPKGDPNLEQDAIDFKVLSNRVGDSSDDWDPTGINGATSAKTSGVRENNDFLDWLYTVRWTSDVAYSHAFERWRGTHSPAWLVASLMAAGPESPNTGELLEAAAKVPQTSPAFDAVTYHSLRLMAMEGKTTEARERLDDLDIERLGPPASMRHTQPSALNQFLSLRFFMSRGLGDIFKFAPRVPALITDPMEVGDKPLEEQPGEHTKNYRPQFDGDALTVLNRYLPAALLAKGMDAAKLPKNLQRDVVLAAWMRATLLGKETVARSLAPAAEALEPSLKKTISAFDSATTPEGREFTAALAALRFPGLRPFVMAGREIPLGEIDDFRDNWWGTLGPVCSPPNTHDALGGDIPAEQWPEIRPALQGLYPGGKVKPPAFLSASEREEAGREWKQLLAMAPGPDYLSARVIAYAKAHPADPLVPEALARAVKSTRYGCTDAKTGQYSKEAFMLLHSRYPETDWARNTKYWFN